MILALPVNGLICRVLGEIVCVQWVTVSVIGVISVVTTLLTVIVDGEIMETENVAVPATSVVKGAIIAEETVLEP
jgi:hypothetical protein